MKLHGSNAASIGYSSNPEEPERDRREDRISDRFDDIWGDSELLIKALVEHSVLEWRDVQAAVLAAATYDVVDQQLS